MILKRFLIASLILFVIISAKAQSSLTAFIKDADTKEPLIGASIFIKKLSIGTTSNEKGLVSLSNIPDGKHLFRISYVGYSTFSETLNFPLGSIDTLTFLLIKEEEEIEEVVISTTRSTRTIQDIPTRVEFIAGEEMEEKANMKPGDIRMVLSESTGIQTQQTSATSANSSIRIQGLDGRYTQILKDGLPIYSGYSGGLGLLQTPPLDLKQVEVVKGSASTLYGGGAIAGLINLISKTPGEERELRFLVNGTSALGLDLNGFYSEDFGKLGLTVYAARNSSEAYDPANIGLSAIPDFERYTLNPKVFYKPTERSKIIFGVNTTFEDRLGGEMDYIKGDKNSSGSYFERNKTNRFSTQLSFDQDFGKCSHFTVKNSLNSFNRQINIPYYTFDGNQRSSFTEVNFAKHGAIAEWVVGANLLTDQFREKARNGFPVRDYDQTTMGVFLQNVWKTTDWFNLETGFRTDYVVDYGVAFLPRISALFKISPQLTSRLGGGFGYKAPTIFTEESERIHYRYVWPGNAKEGKLERSYGANWDINYKTSLFDDKVSLNFNHLFFYTYLNHPLQLRAVNETEYTLENIIGFVDSKGTETNIKIGYGDFKLFLGYTFTDAKTHYNKIARDNPLTPKHRINSVLMYEVEEKWKIGLEAYYFSEQKLSDGSIGKDYLICGFMVEKLWEKFSLFINFENFLDARQTKFDTIYTGTTNNPVFRDIYAPLDGFVINGGVKLRL